MYDYKVIYALKVKNVTLMDVYLYYLLIGCQMCKFNLSFVSVSWDILLLSRYAIKGGDYNEWI